MLLDRVALVVYVLLVGLSAEGVGWGTGFRGGIVGGCKGRLGGGSGEVVGRHFGSSERGPEGRKCGMGKTRLELDGRGGRFWFGWFCFFFWLTRGLSS